MSAPKYPLEHAEQKVDVGEHRYLWSVHLFGDIELAAAHGVKLSYYTVNDAEQAQSLFDEGVIALFTDFLPPV